EFARETIDHGGLVTLASGSDQPADRESLTALRTNVDRNLVGCTADAARTDFNVRGDVLEGRVEDTQRLLLDLALHGVERAVYDALGHGLLAVEHDGIH